MIEEVWREVKGYEGFYQVSNLGRVRSVDRVITYIDGRVTPTKGKLLKLNTKGIGYKTVVLKKNGVNKDFSVHRLVALAFVANPNPTEFTQINHKDEIPSNNESTNLEWCTQEYNNNYGNRIKNAAKSRTNKGGRSVIATNLQTDEQTYYVTMGEAERQGFFKANIFKCCQGTKKQYKGYTWRYADITTKGEKIL